MNISINTRVMLRTNLWVKGGLSNSTMGAVKNIVYASNTRPRALIKFNNYKGLFVYNVYFPILPIQWSHNVIM